MPLLKYRALQTSIDDVDGVNGVIRKVSLPDKAIPLGIVRDADNKIVVMFLMQEDDWNNFNAETEEKGPGVDIGDKIPPVAL